MNLFKIEYTWYEGEHDETLLGKDVKTEEFENDLKKAKDFAQSLIGRKEIDSGEGDYLGKGYSCECLPQYYRQILWYLTTKLGYIDCDMNECVHYDVSDWGKDKIILTKFEKETISHELK